MYLREINKQMLTDLELKIVILSGPRQVGKTTVSKNLMSQFQYLNYDSTKDRKVIAAESWNRETDLVIFDEIQKKRIGSLGSKDFLTSKASVLGYL